MKDTRIHRAVSTDGTEVAGRVIGQGPPLVLVHGAIGDGEISWDAVVPHLSDSFTCYMPSTRGRGLSADHADHSPPRLEEDVTAFVESIGEPVHLVGWSGSGAWVLGAASRSTSVAAVAAYEPVLISVMGVDDAAQTLDTMVAIGAAAADGRLTDAVREFASWICTDDEVAALERADFFDRWADRIPAMLRLLQQDGTYTGSRPTDPDVLAQVTSPVLLLRGGRTRLGPFFTDVADYIAQHVADPHVWELPGVGHFAPVTAPKSIAEELITFFESARQPA